MSRLTEFHLYDEATLRELWSGFRLAEGASHRILRVLDAAAGPRWPRKKRERLEAKLARLLAIEAPEVLVDHTRAQLHPKSLLKDKVSSGQALTWGEVANVALRAVRQIPDSYAFIEWLADKLHAWRDFMVTA